MTTIILGLTAIIVTLGFGLKRKKDEIRRLENKLINLDVLSSDYCDSLKREHAEEKENWRQTTNNWILEKGQHIEKLEQEKFDQMHELALMLNDSYDVDKVILKKAELHDFMLHNANRNQRRQFIDKGYINL